MAETTLTDEQLLDRLQRRARHIGRVVGTLVDRWNNFGEKEKLNGALFRNADESLCAEYRRQTDEGALLVFDNLVPVKTARGTRDCTHSVVIGYYDGRQWVSGAHVHWPTFAELVLTLYGNAGDESRLPFAKHFTKLPVSPNTLRNLKRPIAVVAGG